jgi:hypothetical protein
MHLTTHATDFLLPPPLFFPAAETAHRSLVGCTSLAVVAGGNEGTGFLKKIYIYYYHIYIYIYIYMYICGGKGALRRFCWRLGVVAGGNEGTRGERFL